MITKIVSIDIFQQDTTFNVSVEVDATLTIGAICEDTSVYDFDVDNICDVEVETECVLEDDSINDCRLIPPAE